MKYALFIVVYLYGSDDIRLQEEYISHINLTASQCLKKLDDFNRDEYRKSGPLFPHRAR